MAHYACISGDQVANVIVGDLEFVLEWGHGYDHVIECGSHVHAGWKWNADGGFIAPPAVEIITEEPTKEAGN